MGVLNFCSIPWSAFLSCNTTIFPDYSSFVCGHSIYYDTLYMLLCTIYTITYIKYSLWVSRKASPSFYASLKLCYLFWPCVLTLWIYLLSFSSSPKKVSSSFSRTATFTMKFHEFSQFKLELLQHFGFSNKHIMEQINRLARLFYLFSNAFWNQFIERIYYFFICVLLLGHDFHLLPDLEDLLMLSIRDLANLMVVFFSTNTE